MNVRTRFFVNLCAINLKAISVVLALFCAICLGPVANGQVYFQDNFEDGTIDGQPNPQWSWKPPLAPDNVHNASLWSMYGATDIYSVSNDMAFSGNNSLRLDFGGRNNWCNNHGWKDVVLTQSDIDSGSVAVTGAPWDDFLYNKTNGHSKWAIESYDENEVRFNTTTAAGESMEFFPAAGFTAGDTISIPFKGGVNGTVGGNPDRRNDCDKSINYLDRVQSDDVGFGETLSRSFYMYIPSETTLPEITFKLGYSVWKIGTSNTVATLSISRTNGLGVARFGNRYVNKLPDAADLYTERDQWYYFEELFTRETSEGATDAEHKLFFGLATDDLSEPVVAENGFTLGTLNRMSFNGNWQHFNEVSGYVYFDDYLISVVPEPSSAALGFLAAISLLARRRRRRCSSK